MPSASLSRIIQDTHALPSIPGVASRLLERLQDPETHAAEISTLIEMDPALSLKVLQLANSAMFAPASPVHSIERAIMLLGFNTVRFLITGVAVLQVAQKMPENEIINPESFWRSAFRGAVAAKYFAEQCDYAESNEAYLAGLIREIGRIALIQCAYETYLAVVQAAREANVPVVNKEKELLGFTHADVGALLAVKWNLDEGLAGVIAAYPFPCDYPDLNNLPLTTILHLADRFASLDNPGPELFPQLFAELDPLVAQHWAQAQDLSPEILEAHWQTLKPLLEQGNLFI
ncbi:MAG: HDOD domain-containing protein [Candidatus Sericytochromatia bacterium]